MALPVPIDDGLKSNPGKQSVFISYSREDIKWLRRLKVQLAPFMRRDSICVWDDTRIQSGMPWRAEIEAALASAIVAIVIVSPSFLASDFIADNELPVLLEAARLDGLTILPIVVEWCAFSLIPELARYQAVNDPARPLGGQRRTEWQHVLYQTAVRVESLLRPGSTGRSDR